MEGKTDLFYEFEDYRIDQPQGVLLKGGEIVPLSLKAFDILLVLVENKGRIVNKKDLMQRVWPETTVEEANLANNISAIRKALGDTPDGGRYIQTVPRRGYRFVPDVKEVQDNTAEDEIVVDKDTDLEPRQRGTSTGNANPFSNRMLIKIIIPTLIIGIGLGVLIVRKMPDQHKEDKIESEIEIIWPSHGMRVTGSGTFRAKLINVPLSRYNLYWQVDGDKLNIMLDNEQYGYKQALIDFTGWNWHDKDGKPYVVTFLARDLNGRDIAKRSIDIYVFH